MRALKISLVFAFVLASMSLIAGCPGQKADSGGKAVKSTANPVADGEVVAKVGDAVITLKEFEEQLNQQNPLIRARYKSLEQKKKLLTNLVEREAMVQEAKRLGLDEDPEMVRGYKKILARHLVNMEFNKKLVHEIDISDEEIQRYYDENKDRYHSPEKVRVHHILFAGAATDKTARQAARAKAREVLAELKAKPTDRRLFLELARKNSQDEATRNVGGDTNFKTHEQMSEKYGKTFADAAFGLEKANDLSGLVETDLGVHVLRQSGRQAAIDLPLEKVKGQIRTTLFARARGDAYQGFVEGIKTRVGVQIFDDKVSAAKVDVSDAPSGPHMQNPMRKGPAGHPGGLPGKGLVPGKGNPRLKLDGDKLNLKKEDGKLVKPVGDRSKRVQPASE